MNNDEFVDVIAMIAMLGLIQRHRVIPPDVLAREAYIHAEAMMKEKELRLERQKD
jgi:hypothetical protein